MSNTTTRILARIRALEIEREKLLPLRKEEIFNVLKAAGGLALDNRLLAGLAIYASNPENINSNFMSELIELGQKKIPSRGIRASTKKKTSRDFVLSKANTEEKARG